MTKRSKSVALTILGAAAFTLAGCQEEKVEAQAFPDLQTCKLNADEGSVLTPADCDAAFAEAQALHVESAPRYESRELCEQEHGPGGCGSEAEATQGGSGSIFMPLLTGYLIGNLLSGGGRGMAAAQPLYKTSDGRFTNASGSSSFSTNNGRGTMNATQFTRPAATAGKPPMTRAMVASRGGFGKSSTAGRSYGG
ncbi:DUF1190 domain-containing protein [Cognatishimia sp. SS12]|uniref:DUF1190 domain-containing protein n=1 Tax=Cognatishimia sp. SS12 TaxID=2979465 RepID=UPI00232AD6A4|nr:DUF1190 domain-containing protein [Cognatishimia sp. SS12]MDC0738891.1 DUF1190 domain-containing protein [Cognatishimia sp. SS12]